VSAFDKAKIAEAMAKVRAASTVAEIEEWTGRLADLLTDAYEVSSEYDVRLHAINLSVALHKDTFRFQIGGDKGGGESEDVTSAVLASADRFADWLSASGRALDVEVPE
jgi:hypothetical protein